MKTNLATVSIALLSVAAVLTGCITTSIYPFYSDKDVVSEPGLDGQWTKVDEAKEQWKFVAKGNGYQLTFTDGEKTNRVAVHCFRVGGELFLDLFNPEPTCDVMPPPVPSHLLLRVFGVTPTLRMSSMNYDWLEKLLQKQPEAIQHLMIKSPDDAADQQVILTARTPELQRFILHHLKTDEAWKDVFELKHN